MLGRVSFPSRCSLVLSWFSQIMFFPKNIGVALEILNIPIDCVQNNLSEIWKHIIHFSNLTLNAYIEGGNCTAMLVCLFYLYTYLYLCPVW